MNSRFAPLAALLLALLTLFATRADALCPPSTAYAAGPNPHGVVIADFNEDGNLDVAVANAASESGGPGSNTVSIRLGDGNGGFGSETQYATANTPYFAAAGDLNGDGILDLAVSCINSGVVRVLLGGGSGGVGNGTFSSGGDFPAGPSPFRIAIGDYNEDGRLDLAVVNNTYGGAGLSVLLAVTPSPGGVAYAAPAAYPLASAPTGITTADFDEDGILDLVALIYGPGKVLFLKGNGSAGVGNGTFAAPSQTSTVDGAFDVQTGDFNEDGILDVAVGGNGDGVGVHLGLGSGGVGNGQFGPVSYLNFGGNNGDVAIADLDGDGILDIACNSASNNNVFVFTGLGSGGVGNGGFGLPATYGMGAFPIMIAAGDLDEDGHPDLVSGAYHGAEIRVLLSDCAPPPPPPSPYPHVDAVHDVPNDDGGKVFVVWQRSAYDGDLGTSVTGYRVWRRVPAFAPSSLGLDAASDRFFVRTDGAAVTYWEAVATLPAQRLEGYGYTAATTQDSLAGSNPFTAFFVTALTANANVFYNSNVDSGYSVDNKHPAAPQGFAVTYAAQGATLHWHPNLEPDLAGYALYRGASSAFEPGSDLPLASTTDTTYTDAAGGPGSVYKLTAEDVHGNRSDFAVAGSSSPVGVGPRPLTLALTGPWPNPSRSGVFSVSVSHPFARVTFEVFDVRGTRVYSRGLESDGPGVHAFTAGAERRLAPGLYLVRVTSGSEVREAKTVVVP